MTAAFYLSALIAQMILIFLYNPFGTDCICDPILLNNRFIVGNNLHQKRCSKKLRAIIGDDKDEEESLESIQFEASIL